MGFAGRGALRRRELVVIVVLVVAAAGLVLFLALPSSKGSDNAKDESAGGQKPSQSQRSPSSSEKGPLSGLERREKGDPVAMGRRDAPVVMVEFADYRCPFCAKFSRDTEPKLIKRYVDAGKLRIEWRDFPMYGEQSRQAARAGRAAAAQGKFWQFNKAAYADAPEHGHPKLPKKKLLAFARKAGVEDMQQFEHDMNGKQAKKAVERDFSDGNEKGVPSTPSFVINGQPLLGAQPLDEFTQMIDAAGGDR